MAVKRKLELVDTPEQLALTLGGFSPYEYGGFTEHTKRSTERALAKLKARREEREAENSPCEGR